MGAGYFNIFGMIWNAGLVSKIVMLFLGLLSVFSWAIIIKKWKEQKELERANLDFLTMYYAAESLKDVSHKAQKLSLSAFKNIFLAGHDELNKLRGSFPSEGAAELLKHHFQHYGIGSIERSLKKGINHTNMKLDGMLSILASVGSVTPFVGLFGTVWGIVNAFSGLSSGGATLEAVAPGIAEALLATAFGLAAAIPAVAFFNYFSNENARLNVEMENFGQDFLNLIERSLAVKKTGDK